jgi:hypothetical protein
VVCEHSQPPDQHSVLDGWSQTGVPLWKNLTTVLLDTKDDQLDVIYGETPGPVIVWRSEPELLGQTLPEFMDGSISARPVGALVAGGFALPSPNGDPELLSVTALIQESRAGRSTPKYTLNLISSTPPPHHLASLVGSGICIALTNWVRSLRSSLSSLQHQLSSMAQKGNRTSIQKSRQLVVERLIESRSYLKTLRRRSERRTLHAEERSTEPDRPTSAAISDLRSCDLDDLYHDRKESTIIVRGKQGRIHVFTVNGRHVTSAIYGRDAIHARIARHRWRKMDPKEGQFFLANTCKDLPRIDSQEKDVS